MAAIRAGKVTYRPLSRSDAIDVMKLCLQRNDELRPTVDQLLQHQLLKATAGGQVWCPVILGLDPYCPDHNRPSLHAADAAGHVGDAPGNAASY